MYAFIVNNLWSNYGSGDMACFLRDVGTPMLSMAPNEGKSFNSVSGFYVKVEEGWALRFRSDLARDNGGLLHGFASLNLS